MSAAAQRGAAGEDPREAPVVTADPVRGQPTIGVVGGTGAVGEAAIRELHRRGLGRLRVGGRRIDAARRRVAEDLNGDGEALPVDIEDAPSLASFCDGCRVVVNCAGPSFRILDRVARSAATTGAECVDVAGDEPIYTRLADPDPALRERTVVLGAGMMPGLSGLLGRRLADATWRPTHLTVYVGGRDGLTGAAAADYLAALDDGFGESLAAWRNGRPAARALEPLRDVQLPFFPARVTAHPYLSREAERLARNLRLVHMDWYNVFDGPHALAALRRLQGAGRETWAAAELSRAAALDLFGRAPYQLMVFILEGEHGGVPAVHTLVLRAGSGSELSGAVAAAATEAVLERSIDPGVHFAADALDPRIALKRICDSPAVRTLEMVEGGSGGEALTTEEGVL